MKVRRRKMKKEKNDMTEKLISSCLECKPEEFYKKYKAYKDAEAEFKELYEPFKDRLLQLYNGQLISDKTIIIGGAKLTYVEPSIRTSIDNKKLKEEEPELAKKYTKTTSVAATIRVEGV